MYGGNCHRAYPNQLLSPLPAKRGRGRGMAPGAGFQKIPHLLTGFGNARWQLPPRIPQSTSFSPSSEAWKGSGDGSWRRRSQNSSSFDGVSGMRGGSSHRAYPNQFLSPLPAKRGRGRGMGPGAGVHKAFDFVNAVNLKNTQVVLQYRGVVELIHNLPEEVMIVVRVSF